MVFLIWESDIEKIQLVGQLPRGSSTQHRSGVLGILNAVSGRVIENLAHPKGAPIHLRARPTDSTLTTVGLQVMRSGIAPMQARSAIPGGYEGPPPDERRAQVDVASLERPSPQVAADLQYPAAE